MQQIFVSKQDLYSRQQGTGLTAYTQRTT